MADAVAEALTPITQERVEAQLTGFGLQHFRNDEGLTVTAFPGMVSFFEFADAGCKITTRWLGAVESQDDTRTLHLRANELNRFIPVLRVHPMTRSDGSTIALMEAPLFATFGVSDSQLTAMLEFYFSTVHQLQAELRKALPHIPDEMVPETGAENTEA